MESEPVPKLLADWYYGAVVPLLRAYPNFQVTPPQTSGYTEDGAEEWYVTVHLTTARQIVITGLIVYFLRQQVAVHDHTNHVAGYYYADPQFTKQLLRHLERWRLGLRRRSVVCRTLSQQTQPSI